jgi:hypothetical protein
MTTITGALFMLKRNTFIPATLLRMRTLTTTVFLPEELAVGEKRRGPCC